LNATDIARRAARAPRLKVFQPVEVDSGSGPTRAHLLNVSHTGALVHCASAPDEGASIYIGLPGTSRHARVVWRDGKRFGAEFVGQLTAAQIEEVLAAQTSLAARAPRHAGPVARAA
jgi:hypothetical protein